MSLGLSVLTHWWLNRLAELLQSTFSNKFVEWKLILFCLKFYWSLFLSVQLTNSHHWFKFNSLLKPMMTMIIDPYGITWPQWGGGWGWEVSCGGHHRLRGKTTTGSALDGVVFDIAQILAYLVHSMNRSQLYLGFGHFGWLPSFFGQ